MTKNGEAALSEIAVAAVRSKLFRFLLKKHWFLCEATNLDLQPALSLTKNVRTPNSVWGITGQFMSNDDTWTSQNLDVKNKSKSATS